MRIQWLITSPLTEKRRCLGLDPKHIGLVILDEFKGQTTEKVLKLLEANDLMYVIVPLNYTDCLQPLDVSVNRAAKQFLRTKFENWYGEQIVVMVLHTISNSFKEKVPSTCFQSIRSNVVGEGIVYKVLECDHVAMK